MSYISVIHPQYNLSFCQQKRDGGGGWLPRQHLFALSPKAMKIKYFLLLQILNTIFKNEIAKSVVVTYSNYLGKPKKKFFSNLLLAIKA